jgi:alkylated DNA repair dioxygenase AlkB
VTRIPLSPESWLDYSPGWLEEREAEVVEQALLDELVWEQREIVLFGRRILQPRLIAWAGDRPYRYSGQTLEVRPFSRSLAALRRRVELATERAFNHALVNRYRDGADSMGFHSDDEPELGEHPVLASISLGATRCFVLEPKQRSRRSERRELELERGSLLIFGGDTQAEFRHALPKARAPIGERVNVTFRNLLGDPGGRAGGAMVL